MHINYAQIQCSSHLTSVSPRFIFYRMRAEPSRFLLVLSSFVSMILEIGLMVISWNLTPVYISEGWQEAWKLIYSSRVIGCLKSKPWNLETKIEL